MEKRIGFFEFQQVKSVAKACDPSIRQRNKIRAQIEKLATEYKREQEKIDMLEAGIKTIIGFSVEQLVKKVIETDAKGNKVTKYLPTDIVRYDEATKQYVITVSDEGTETSESIVPPTTEEGPGTDFDEDKEKAEEEEEDPNALPFEEESKNEPVF